jgi:hypothetical protein
MLQWNGPYSSHPAYCSFRQSLHLPSLTRGIRGRHDGCVVLLRFGVGPSSNDSQKNLVFLTYACSLVWGLLATCLEAVCVMVCQELDLNHICKLLYQV